MKPLKVTKPSLDIPSFTRRLDHVIDKLVLEQIIFLTLRKWSNLYLNFLFNLLTSINWWYFLFFQYLIESFIGRVPRLLILWWIIMLFQLKLSLIFMFLLHLHLLALELALILTLFLMLNVRLIWLWYLFVTIFEFLYNIN